MESAALRSRPSVVRVYRDLIQLVQQQPTRCSKQESQICIFNDRTLYLKYPSIGLLQKVSRNVLTEWDVIIRHSAQYLGYGPDDSGFESRQGQGTFLVSK
jgi:hypothetical protein